jgi:hypothetical protein
MLNFEEVKNALLENKWIYAKTMPQCPHWYTLRSDWKSDISFDDVVQFIRDYGYRERFYKKVFIRFDVDNMKYWTMGSPINKTILINRAVIDDDKVSVKL